MNKVQISHKVLHFIAMYTNTSLNIRSWHRNIIRYWVSLTWVCPVTTGSFRITDPLFGHLSKMEKIFFSWGLNVYLLKIRPINYLWFYLSIFFFYNFLCLSIDKYQCSLIKKSCGPTTDLEWGCHSELAMLSCYRWPPHWPSATDQSASDAPQRSERFFHRVWGRYSSAGFLHRTQSPPVSETHTHGHTLKWTWLEIITSKFWHINMNKQSHKKGSRSAFPSLTLEPNELQSNVTAPLSGFGGVF